MNCSKLFREKLVQFKKLGSLLFIFFARGRMRLLERFGLWRSEELQGELLWFHGASLGELKAMKPLLKEVRARYPQYKILVSASSAPALEQMKDCSDYQRLLPFDSSWIVRPLLRKLRIHAFFAAESELWPALLLEVHSRQIPSFLLNAYLSNKTKKRLETLHFFYWPCSSLWSKVFASKEESAENWKAFLGDRVLFSGNTKYDELPEPLSDKARDKLRKELLKKKRAILVLGSVWPGEETFWLESLKNLPEVERPFCILAPRHSEKFSYFEKALKEAGLRFEKRSEQNGSLEVDVLLLDTFGELAEMYAISDLSFIGGSLVDVGGHNPMEAAARLSLPVMGPYTYKMEEVREALSQKNSLEIVKTQQEVEALVKLLQGSAEELRKRGVEARQVAESLSGASDIVLGLLENSLAEQSFEEGSSKMASGA